MQKQVPDLVAKRKAIMAKPEQWEPLIRELEQMYHAPAYVKQKEVKSIPIPTLIMAGDRDYYNQLSGLVDTFHLLPRASGLHSRLRARCIGLYAGVSNFNRHFVSGRSGEIGANMPNGAATVFCS